VARINELDQVKALADRAAGLYQTFSAGIFCRHFLQAFSAGIFCRHFLQAFSAGIFCRHFLQAFSAGVFTVSAAGEIIKADWIDRFL
jgi:hypothetical protein